MRRRRFLLGALTAGLGLRMNGVAAQDANQWYPLVGDKGEPVANSRLPVELTSEVDDLPGAIWLGSESRALTIVEFFDYNCPYCRAVVPDLHELLQSDPELRVGLVNNPILSARSVEAAKVELALTLLGGPSSVYKFHRRLFERRGPIDGRRALEVSDALGAPRAKVEELLAGRNVQEMLSEQMRLAASLGLTATPSFLIAGAGVLGYPGRKALEGILDAVRGCGRIAC